MGKTSAAGKTKVMNDPLPERVKRFYERVNTEREGALVELPQLYAGDVVFANPVKEARGLPTFEAFWREAFRKYHVFRFDDLEVTGDETFFTMTYTMTVRFRIGPEFPTLSATDFHAEGGKVVRTRDYFDPLGALLAPFPVADWVYKKLFGLLVA